MLLKFFFVVLAKFVVKAEQIDDYIPVVFSIWANGLCVMCYCFAFKWYGLT